MSRNKRIQPLGDAERQPVTQPGELFDVSITGINVKIHGRALLILALGIAAAMGAIVVLRISLS